MPVMMNFLLINMIEPFHSPFNLCNLRFIVVCYLSPLFFLSLKVQIQILTYSNTIPRARISDNNERSETETLFVSMSRERKIFTSPLVSIRFRSFFGKKCFKYTQIAIAVLSKREKRFFIPLSGFILIPSVERFNGFILMFCAVCVGERISLIVINFDVRGILCLPTAETTWQHWQG